MKLNRPSNYDFRGTKFQKKVWGYLKTIRKGTVKTYKQVAIAINRPKSARAVANAVGKNPFPPKIPCNITTIGKITKGLDNKTFSESGASLAT